jgi:predicted dehydrogenase
VSGSVVISQISSGRKNRLFIEIAGAEATLAFDQERPETLWIGRRDASEIVHRDPTHLDPSAAAYATVPPGHPQGYQDCFDAFVADSYRAVVAGSVDAVDGLPNFGDGVRATLITEAVLRSAASHRWEDVDPTSEPKEVTP